MLLSASRIQDRFSERSRDLVLSRDENQSLIDSLYSIATYVGNPSLLDNADGTNTAFGRAITPMSALDCLRDYKRTFRFVRGLFQAIVDVKSRNPDRPVKVLYLGCGPVATLALPICGVMDTSDVQFTVADISQPSINHLKLVASSLGMEDYFQDMMVVNAIDHPFDDDYDICISETMDRALLNEPQVAIMDNIRIHVPSASVVLPQDIRVYASLHDEKGALLGQSPVFSLRDFISNRALAQAGAFTDNDTRVGAKIKLPSDSPSPDMIVLRTHLDIYDTYRLGPNESIITSDYPGNISMEGDHFEISYRLGSTKAGIEIALADVA